jgi:hypothetical protein
MDIRTSFADMLRFAHFLGHRPTPSPRAAAKPKVDEDEDEGTPLTVPEEGSDQKGGEGDRGESKSTDKKKKKRKSITDSNDGEGRENDGDNDEDEGEEHKLGAQAERARCRAIFDHAAATGQHALFFYLALHTDLSADAAIKVLKASIRPPGWFAQRLNSMPAGSGGPGSPDGSFPAEFGSAHVFVLAAHRKAGRIVPHLSPREAAAAESDAPHSFVQWAHKKAGGK